jgi:hypothetical protein
MKTSLDLQLKINVRRQSDEAAAQSELYTGIYALTLNRQSEILFVPAFERNAANWPPALPDDLDVLKSVQEARLFSAALSRHTVTPDRARAGQHEFFEQESGDKDDVAEGILFFVTPQEFESYSRELEALAAETPGIYDDLPLSEVTGCQIVKYLLNRVLRAPYFSESDQKSLVLGTK